jgi:hypothetical protein
VKQVREVVHGRKAADVLGAEDSLTFRKASSKEIFGSGVVSFLLQRQRLLLHRLGAQRGRRRYRLFELFVWNNNGNKHAQKSSKNQQTNSQQAPCRLTTPLCLAGGLLMEIDCENLAGHIVVHRARTSGCYKVNAVLGADGGDTLHIRAVRFGKFVGTAGKEYLESRRHCPDKHLTWRVPNILEGMNCAA